MVFTFVVCKAAVCKLGEQSIREGNKISYEQFGRFLRLTMYFTRSMTRIIENLWYDLRCGITG